MVVGRRDTAALPRPSQRRATPVLPPATVRKPAQNRIHHSSTNPWCRLPAAPPGSWPEQHPSSRHRSPPPGPTHLPPPPEHTIGESLQPPLWTPSSGASANDSRALGHECGPGSRGHAQRVAADESLLVSALRPCHNRSGGPSTPSTSASSANGRCSAPTLSVTTRTCQSPTLIDSPDLEDGVHLRTASQGIRGCRVSFILDEPLPPRGGASPQDPMGANVAQRSAEQRFVFDRRDLRPDGATVRLLDNVPARPCQRRPTERCALRRCEEVRVWPTRGPGGRGLALRIRSRSVAPWSRSRWSSAAIGGHPRTRPAPAEFPD